MFTALVATALVNPAWSVLVFSKTAGFRHDSIETGTQCIRDLGKENGFEVAHTEDSAQFNKENLAKFKMVVFLNTTQDVLDDTQQVAFESYIRNGGGFVGVHAASDTEYKWPFYRELVGAYFISHPQIQKATINVLDRKHPSTNHLPEKWERTDEWYDYDAAPAEGVHILCKLDTASYTGHKMGENHPIAWCHEKFKGRSFYTGMGHTKESYADPAFQKHLLGGILWVARIKN